MREDTVALVTGSSRGIGRAIALKLGELGAKVIINFRADEKAAQQTMSQLESLTDVICVRSDTTKPDDVEHLVGEAMRRFGRIDVLVNNVGLARPAKLVDMDLKTWKAVIDTALDSCFLCTHAVLPGMLERGHGRIVNISSAYGVIGSYGQANYCAAKAGVIGFTRAVALETAKRGVTVNAVAPGLIDTDMVAEVPERIAQRIVDQTPMGRMGQPADVASIVAFLASEDAAYVTGQVMSVNGGLHM